jgi:hypothetical protein
VQIALTPEGRRLAFSAKAAVLDLVNEIVGPYAKAETDMLISLLQRLVLHMEGIAGRLAAEPSSAEAKTASARRAAAAVPVKGPRKARRDSRK